MYGGGHRPAKSGRLLFRSDLKYIEIDAGDHCGGFNPLTPGEGEISLPHSRAIFSKLKNEDKDLFSFRNFKK